jgi:hypothetical protein
VNESELIKADADAPALLSDMHRYFLVLVFGKTNSYSYELAVMTARRAPHYTEWRRGRNLLHIAAFDEPTDDVFRLARYIEGWKLAHLYVWGRMQGLYGAVLTLNCYAAAARCTDYKAHCYVVVSGIAKNQSDSTNGYYLSSGTTPDQYIFPCRLLHPYFRFQKGLGLSAEVQIQASAVERGCEWCPLFDPGAYAKLDGA